MSSFLSACKYDVAHVSLSEILAMEYVETSMVWENNTSDHDYQGVIRSILVKYADKAVQEKKYQEDAYPTYSYTFNSLNKQAKPFNYFSIEFFKNGKINTFCSGSGYGSSPREQCTTYSLDKENAQNLYNEIKARMDEVERIKNEQEAKARDAANIYMLLNEFDNPRDITTRWIDYQEMEEYEERGKSKTRYNQLRLYKITTELVDDLRALEYEEMIGDYRPIKDTIVECRGSDDWTISFERYHPYATIRYCYDNTLTWTSLCVTYKVNETKKNEFVKKVETLLKDQATL